MKTAVVTGAGGFIGGHLVKRLKKEGYWVRGVDIKYHEFEESAADQFMIADLRLLDEADRAISHGIDEVYALAADMGGSEYIFSGEHDADVMNNSALINIHTARRAMEIGVQKLFFSSSACIYPRFNQEDPNNPNCAENTAYPALPDSCLHPDTEVLTINGFKLIKDLSTEDLVATLNPDGILEYNKPTDKQEIEFSGNLININTKYLSCNVTAEHNIVECDKYGGNIKNTKAIDFINRNKTIKGLLKRNCDWVGTPFNRMVKIDPIAYTKNNTNSLRIENRNKKGYEFYLRDYLEFVAWFVTEGNAGFYKGNFIVQIRQVKESNLERIIELCNRMDISPYVPQKRGRVILYSKSLWYHFKQLGGGAKNKHLPTWVLSLPKEDLKLLYDVMMLGDGSGRNGKYCYTTTSPILRDQFVEICLKIGFACSIRHIKKTGNYNDIYHVNISKQHLIHKVNKNNISFSNYTGKVYDITIPNHIFYIRYNGKHMWTGNCYGWEKLFSEQIYLAYQRNYNLDVRIARLHNIFGEKGSWNNGKEKAPAAICRKVAQAENGMSITIFGDGLQTRSFLYIDECIEAVIRLMNAPQAHEPLNIGSEEMVSINQLTDMIMEIADKKLLVNHINGFTGVRGRCSDNKLIEEKLGWQPNYPLKKGLKRTYPWILEQVNKTK